MQIDLGPARAFGGQFFESVAVFFFQVEQHALDVFAGADQVGLVIGAGARVLHLVQRANFYAIGRPETADLTSNRLNTGWLPLLAILRISSRARSRRRWIWSWMSVGMEKLRRIYKMVAGIV
ncbi:MAG: hypothetical protein C0393_03580 [Anaerolinea sp.]|nr:hypothetical protein [Anaerolinea sp.]